MRLKRDGGSADFGDLEIYKKDFAEFIGDTHELTTRDPDAAGKDDRPGGNGDKCGPLPTFAYFSVEIFHNARTT